jgi:hypothetical protein
MIDDVLGAQILNDVSGSIKYRRVFQLFLVFTRSSQLHFYILNLSLGS